MQGDPQIIAMLNRLLSNELVSINQYTVHALILKHQGLHKISAFVYREAVDEMKHADALMQRILMLSGMPEMKVPKPTIGKTPTSIFRADLKLEKSGHKDLCAGIQLCEKKADFVSRELLHGILETEEKHMDWLETQLDLVKTLGLENYLQSAAGEVDQE